MPQTRDWLEVRVPHVGTNKLECLVSLRNQFRALRDTSEVKQSQARLITDVARQNGIQSLCKKTINILTQMIDSEANRLSR